MRQEKEKDKNLEDKVQEIEKMHPYEEVKVKNTIVHEIKKMTDQKEEKSEVSLV